MTDLPVSEKQCFRCGESKPLSEFYTHPMMGDGHLGKCKECTKRDVRANRRIKLEQYREYDRDRFKNDPERRAAQYAYTAQLEEKYPEKRRARHMVSNAIRDGRLIRKPCEVCGHLKAEAHHDDYSKPLDVRWLCKDHHEAFHHSMEEAG